MISKVRIQSLAINTKISIWYEKYLVKMIAQTNTLKSISLTKPQNKIVQEWKQPWIAKRAKSTPGGAVQCT